MTFCTELCVHCSSAPHLLPGVCEGAFWLWSQWRQSHPMQGGWTGFQERFHSPDNEPRWCNLVASKTGGRSQPPCWLNPFQTVPGKVKKKKLLKKAELVWCFLCSWAEQSAAPVILWRWWHGEQPDQSLDLLFGLDCLARGSWKRVCLCVCGCARVFVLHMYILYIWSSVLSLL